MSFFRYFLEEGGGWKTKYPLPYEYKLLILLSGYLVMDI